MIKVYYYGKSVFTLESLQKNPKLYGYIQKIFKSIKRYMESHNMDYIELAINATTNHRCIIKDKHNIILYDKYFMAVSDYLTKVSPPYSYGLNYASFWRDMEKYNE